MIDAKSRTKIRTRKMSAWASAAGQISAPIRKPRDQFNRAAAGGSASRRRLRRDPGPTAPDEGLLGSDNDRHPKGRDADAARSRAAR